MIYYTGAAPLLTDSWGPAADRAAGSQTRSSPALRHLRCAGRDALSSSDVHVCTRRDSQHKPMTRRVAQCYRRKPLACGYPCLPCFRSGKIPSSRAGFNPGQRRLPGGSKAWRESGLDFPFPWWDQTPAERLRGLIRWLEKLPWISSRSSSVSSAVRRYCEGFIGNPAGSIRRWRRFWENIEISAPR